MSDIKVGDIVRVQANVYGSIEFCEFKIEKYHDCLGFFTSDYKRKGGLFTPLCMLLEQDIDSREYISNFGEIFTRRSKICDVYRDGCHSGVFKNGYNSDIAGYLPTL